MDPLRSETCWSIFKYFKIFYNNSNCIYELYFCIIKCFNRHWCAVQTWRLTDLNSTLSSVRWFELCSKSTNLYRQNIRSIFLKKHLTSVALATLLCPQTPIFNLHRGFLPPGWKQSCVKLDIYKLLPRLKLRGSLPPFSFAFLCHGTCFGTRQNFHLFYPAFIFPPPRGSYLLGVTSLMLRVPWAAPPFPPPRSGNHNSERWIWKTYLRLVLNFKAT